MRGAPAADDPPPIARLIGVVTRVADGDTVTVRLSNGLRNVRLIGVDAPEMHESAHMDRDLARSHLSEAVMTAMGKKARDFVVERLQGKRITLSLDVEHYDGYGRMLAYVWLSDEVLFNEELVRAGYARAYTVPPNVRYARELRAAAADARKNKRGLWQEGLEALEAQRPFRGRAPRASRVPAEQTPPAPPTPVPPPPVLPVPPSPAPGARRSPS